MTSRCITACACYTLNLACFSPLPLTLTTLPSTHNHNTQVFENAAGFLRVRGAARDAYEDELDGSSDYYSGLGRGKDGDRRRGPLHKVGGWVDVCVWMGGCVCVLVLHLHVMRDGRAIMFMTNQHGTCNK